MEPTNDITGADVLRKVEAIRAMDAADENVSPDHGPCRLNAGEDPRLRRAKEEKVSEALVLKNRAGRS
jgi:hypothetical protein